ncbi:hypothetical protein SB00610_05299 [Klebsiella quasipneumoniae subsp. similipneumoniae]|nr:hypothetical protein SB00610_05299 [Klebsiella quasipneumoniae subsp. similipneumoniae]
MPGIAQLLKIALQGAEGHQTGADGGGPLQEARRRFVEVKFHRQRVDHFAALVVIDHLRDRQAVGFIAQPIGVEVFGDGGGIQRRTVREGDPFAQVESVLGFIGITGPALGDPRLNLQRFRVLPGQLVGDLIENAAVWIKAAGGWIEIGVRLLLQIN